MNTETSIGFLALLASSSLAFLAVAISYYQKLHLERDLLISILRAVIQLVGIGFVLEYIFGLESIIFTTLLLAVIIFNAAYNASQRGRGIKGVLSSSFIAIFTGTAITITILVFSGAIQYKAYQIIPVGGMIISNSMVALGLSYRQLLNDFKDRRDEVETKLSLGADIHEASREIIKKAVITGMLPTIDSAKTMGIVALPGMMTGLILAGVPPLEAIKYQIMVVFMIISTTAISAVIAIYLSYPRFYNERKQLKLIKGEANDLYNK